MGFFADGKNSKFYFLIRLAIIAVSGRWNRMLVQPLSSLCLPQISVGDLNVRVPPVGHGPVEEAVLVSPRGVPVSSLVAPEHVPKRNE